MVLAMTQKPVTQGKPPGKGKPPKESVCNFDGICQHEERIDKAFCDDCAPKSYPPLDTMVSPQIVTLFTRDYPDLYEERGPQIFQFRFDGVYEDTWASQFSQSGRNAHAISIGSIDRYNEPVVVSIVSQRTKYRATVYYDQEIYLFHHGNTTGLPDQVLPYERVYGYADLARDSIIADVDNDTRNELVVVGGNKAKIFEWKGDHFELEWESEDLGSRVWSVDVGDADGDDLNELVLAMFSIGSALIFDNHTSGQGGVWTSVATESLNGLPVPSDGVFIDVAKVRDLDPNKGNGNEIVAGGNFSRLAIWKYGYKQGDEEPGYHLEFLSDDLGGFTQYVDAGDVDGDGDLEILVDASQTLTLHLFDFDFGNQADLDWSQFSVTPVRREGGGVSGIAFADFDGDGRDEAVVDTWGISIYELDDDGDFQATFTSAYGGPLEIR